MTESELKDRFYRFSMAIHQLTKQFPKETVYFNIRDQIVRCSSSSGANYHAACRGKSAPDFINKLRMVEEELDESLYWLTYTKGIDMKWEFMIEPLYKEGNELLAIIVASIKTSVLNQNKKNLKFKSKI